MTPVIRKAWIYIRTAWDLLNALLLMILIFLLQVVYRVFYGERFEVLWAPPPGTGGRPEESEATGFSEESEVAGDSEDSERGGHPDTDV